jgi:hypothetical protein
MVTDTPGVTGIVVIAKVAVVAPAGTVTDAGTVVDGSLEDRLTVKPPVGAGVASVICPEEEVPPTTSFGVSVTLEIQGVPIATSSHT